MRRQIGTTDLNVYAVGLGAMPLGIRGEIPQQAITEVIQASVDAGIDFIDTANVYCTDNQDIGLNERSIKAALEQLDVKNVTVATKGGLERPQGRWESRASPQDLRHACEQSLRDLDTESITLYQLHAPDSLVPFAESVGELARLQSEGKIIHIGLSNVNQDQLEEAMSITTITSVQNRCSAIHQKDLRNGFVECCRKNSITYIAYSPVGGGAGRYLLEDNKTLTSLAERHETTVYQIALAWLLAKSDNILPIPGASRASSAVSSANATTVKLTDDEIYQVDCLDR